MNHASSSNMLLPMYSPPKNKNSSVLGRECASPQSLSPKHHNFYSTLGKLRRDGPLFPTIEEGRAWDINLEGSHPPAHTLLSYGPEHVGASPTSSGFLTLPLIRKVEHLCRSKWTHDTHINEMWAAEERDQETNRIRHGAWVALLALLCIIAYISFQAI